MFAYPWQDATRYHESIECIGFPFTLKNLDGFEPLVAITIQCPRYVPLYLRLDPERWPLAIAALACEEQRGSWSTWPEIRAAFVAQAAALLGLAVEDLD